MKIEEAKKYCMDLEYYYVDETHELSKFIYEQQSIINQLQADKLEMAKAIVIEYRRVELASEGELLCGGHDEKYCVYCLKENISHKSNNHDK